ncbi:MAG: helix-turn-helix domain-containing protein [Guyparkeria sp.]|uniref:helix-turn-helix domain-containing protein n=1 Tax=Guyparkeria sp. TaxID=2035736 RepID=UPI00397A5F1A
MGKHSLPCKLRVVRHREQGGFHSRTTATYLGIDRGTAEKWGAAYRLRGEDGLRTRHRRYSSALQGCCLAPDGQ